MTDFFQDPNWLSTVAANGEMLALNAIQRRTNPVASSLPHPFTGEDYECGFPVTYLPELVLMAASNAIREKPNWWEKFKDPVISARWRQELVALREESNMPNQLTDDQIDYLFQELEWYADQRLKHIGPGSEIPIEIAIDGTCRADELVPPELKERLMICVKKLMDVPEEQKDWHPDSDKQVLDLVHPSLFPFIAGRSLVVKEKAIPALEFFGKGEAMEMAPMEGGINEMYYSKRFQWLPTDFTVDAEGKVKFESYINNLHPVDHRVMYPVLEEILALFIPMFEDVLTDMRAYPNKAKRFPINIGEWYDHENFPDFGDDYQADWDWHRSRVPFPIKVPEFSTPTEPQRYDLRTGQKLQVIVKLANIELTPENPKYTGGSWHVEGMANENIVASGIYYYHSENITESRLDFRIHVREPDYEQDDKNGCRIMYGLANYEALNQPLDGIVTKEDRCIAFPNIYQHQVQPFELQDSTKPGTRKILVFFLVNPETTILSTTHVPPQQKEWAPPKTNLMEEAVRKLPQELVDQIDKLVDWPIEMEEACALRLDLMQERKFFVDNKNKDMFERSFYLCEH